MEKREYPAFIIDRSRQSAASRTTDDFVVCTDREVGFIARVYRVPKSRREEFLEEWAADESRYAIRTIGDVVVVLEVVQMLHEPVAHYNRLPPLMRKALKSYIYGEAKAVLRDGQPYDNQLAALDDVLRMCEAQRGRMIDLNGEEATERFIDAVKAARGSVELLKKMTEHGRA